MSTIFNLAKKTLNSLFNTRAAGLYMLLFAAAIGIATFVENDFGTSSAQKLIYKSTWFSILLSLFAITIAVNISRFKMIRQKKWALLTFHSSIIIILLGAAVTRYYGFEGIMHIRENSSSNVFLSSDTHLQFKVIKDDQLYVFDEAVLFATLGNNNFSESYLIGDDLIEATVEEFVPNPKQILFDSPQGLPVIKVVFGGDGGREEYFIQQGETKRIRNTVFNFNSNKIPEAINIDYRNDSLLINSSRTLSQMVMATQKRDTLIPNGKYYPLRLRSLYSNRTSSFVFGDFKAKGDVRIESESEKMKSESYAALKMNLSVNGVSEKIMISGRKGLPGRPAFTTLDDLQLSVSYGAKELSLPFSLRLDDFVMEKYPGTNSAMSYSSDVHLIDSRSNINEDHKIYMNHVLDHDGYRFFQSSFDNDELGTYLSVNHDFWGTWISYIGYILLTLGMILSLFSKKSRFQQISQKLAKLRQKNFSLLLLLASLALPLSVSAQTQIDQSNTQNIIAADHAANFSMLIVQDHKGRMKPVHTLTREVMRKVARTETIDGLSADQIVLGMFANPSDWLDVPLIKLGKHEKIKNKLNTDQKLAAYSTFFNDKGEYIFKEEVRRAYGLQPIDRGVYEKELMKIDERINIANMVFSGHLFKLIPIPNDPNNTWVASDISKHNHDDVNQSVADKFFYAYRLSLKEAMKSNDYSFANTIVNELSAYQLKNGEELIPSQARVKSEIFLNRTNIFGRLSFTYLILSLAFLFCLFFSVFNHEKSLGTAYKFLFAFVALAFALHTLGLGLRWFVSERAPWSNGYESMIYIGWTTVLAGLLFTRKSFGGLAATMLLAATVLLVAKLSYLDPEITPLVPVLRSYWLTIHVSLEAGSYGFLMLGAVIGLINLILFIFLTEKNRERIKSLVKEMTYLSEMTLIGGLFMISVGTYLGGVWANESWGRYWGWDAKETWALVTILVYAFILHMRLMPKINGLFAFNFASIFGLASVIMTYYGVNYYLSGLHSYAAGDPVPIPNWVYIFATSIMIISLLAYMKKRKYKIGN